MSRIAIIGAGVSGLTMGRLLSPRASVTIYEGASRPGGLIKCERVDGNLFHTCGGHVFNTRRQGVLDMFWSIFDRDRDFMLAERNSAVKMPDGTEVPYPIENHAYMLDDETLGKVIADVTRMRCVSGGEPSNFEEFLRRQFGATLYDLYFGPYNRKVWRRDLSTVPLSWLEGKLPMPTPEEILYNNIRRVKEKAFVHSTFYYERRDGSQFLADTLASGLDVRYSTPVSSVERIGDKWRVEGEEYDAVVFCGNIKHLPAMLRGVDIQPFVKDIEALESHGTTAVFCEIEPNPYSWIYLPDADYDAHRIICTGNFSPTNNAPGHMTATVEFTDSISHDEIMRQLPRIPFSPRYITHRYNPYTYPIQHADTRAMITALSERLAGEGLYLTGRFALWEYFNMDVAMDSAIRLAPQVVTA